MAVQFFEDIVVGTVEESGSFVADRADMVAYAQANDPWPIHVDQHFAEGTVFGDITASFGYVVSLFFRAVHTLPINQGSLGDAFLGALEWERVRFRKAVLPDDRLRVRVTVVSKQLGRKGDRGTVTSRCEILNHHDDVVVDLDMVCLYRTRER
jgi:acyl dehydratase